MSWNKLSDIPTTVCLLLLVYQTHFLGTTEATSNIFASGCTGQQLQLSCPLYHKIAIKRVFYGVKKSWDCQLDTAGYRSEHDPGTRDFTVRVNTSDCCRASHTDCRLDGDNMYPTLNIKCSGYQSCELEVQKVLTRDPCRFKAYSDYMTIVYDCVSVGDVAMFCSDDVKRGKSLYLANKEYPSAIRPKPAGDECQCVIRTTHPQGISIHTIDVLLAWAETGPMECRRNLKIQDPIAYQKDIQCAHRGYYGFKSIYSRPVSNVTITLSSLPGDGMAFVWLQAKPNDADGSIEIFCGQSLQDLLSRIRHQSEGRQRENTKKEVDKIEDKKTDDNKADVETEKTPNVANVTVTAGSQALTSDLAAIVGGIVAAGFALIAMVIIATALHCRRVRKEKRLRKPLELQAAVSSESLDLASYCRFDHDEDHLCSINRSSMKMASLADDIVLATSFRPNGFTTITHTGECQLHRGDVASSHPLPYGVSTPPPSLQHQPLLAGRSYREVHYPGDMSLRFVRPLINSSRSFTADTTDNQLTEPQYPKGHTTLPANRKAVLISSGPKSPLGKRSKSVTFSQPVAMVTPLNSESEESMERSELPMDTEDPSYDNLNKLDIPDYPIIPGKTELVKIPKWNHEYGDDSPMQPMSTFHNSPSPPAETKRFMSPSSDLRVNIDHDDTAYMSDSSSTFWGPSRHNGKPLMLPKPQKAELYETGV